ncbi:MAG: Rrf2 family transcriptional regulator [Hyphomicrobiaceae bacterium]|nr:Rrf2 family transcriptional regulator [Hyphomicrobiaceae bacterium]
MRLNKSTSHAIRILIDCTQAGEDLVKAAEISRRLDITPQNTFKIVHLLSRAGFIEAVRGRHGGVRLAKPASEIRIGHVVRAMESMAIEIEGDGAAKPSESKERAAGINQILDNALEAFISVLDQHTLQEMALGKKPGALGTAGGKPRAAKAAASRKAAAVNVPRKRQSLSAPRLS